MKKVKERDVVVGNLCSFSVKLEFENVVGQKFFIGLVINKSIKYNADRFTICEANATKLKTFYTGYYNIEILA